jgi:hypothetical protein
MVNRPAADADGVGMEGAEAGAGRTTGAIALGAAAEERWLNALMAVILGAEATCFAALGFTASLAIATGDYPSVPLMLEIFVLFLMGTLLMFGGAWAFWRAGRGEQLNGTAQMVIAIDTLINGMVAGIAIVQLWSATPIPTERIGPQVGVFMLAAGGTIGRLAWAIRGALTRRRLRLLSEVAPTL